MASGSTGRNGAIPPLVRTIRGGRAPTGYLGRVTHLDFVFVHPFEEGSGRIAPRLAETALARALGRRSLVALSREVARRRAYYQVLERANRSFGITLWLRWFAETAVAAQR